MDPDYLAMDDDDEDNILKTGDLVDTTLKKCPHPLKYLYQVNGSDLHNHKVLVSPNYQFVRNDYTAPRKIKESDSSLMVIIVPPPIPPSFGCVLVNHSYRYVHYLSPYSNSGNTVMSLLDYRPPATQVPIRKEEYFFRSRFAFEILLANYFVVGSIPHDFFTADKTKLRDTMFNSIHGLEDIPRLCVTKIADYDIHVEREEAESRSDGLCLNIPMYWQLLKYPLPNQTPDQKYNLINFNGLSLYYKPNLMQTCEIVQLILKSVYGVVICDGNIVHDENLVLDNVKLFEVVKKKKQTCYWRRNSKF